MGIGKINVKANLAKMGGGSFFRDVGDGETVVFRFMPADEDGILFIKSFNHWGFKNQETGRGLALADLREHGNEETGYEDYIARLSEVLMDFPDGSREFEIGDKIKGNNRFYGQGYEMTIQSDGTFKHEYKFLSVPITGAKSVLAVATDCAALGESDFTDSDEGQAVLVGRTGTAFKTKYTASRSGRISSLGDAMPAWKDNYLTVTEMYSKLKLVLHTPEEQKEIAMFSFPDLDWDMLKTEYNL